MERLFLDASVLVASYLSPAGGSRKICTLSQAHLITSANIIDEVMRALFRYTRISHDREVIAFLSTHSIIIQDHVSLKDAEMYQDRVDIYDAHVFAGAILTRCTHLISLDKKHIVRDDIQCLFRSQLTIMKPGDYLQSIWWSLLNPCSVGKHPHRHQKHCKPEILQVLWPKDDHNLPRYVIARSRRRRGNLLLPCHPGQACPPLAESGICTCINCNYFFITGSSTLKVTCCRFFLGIFSDA